MRTLQEWLRRYPLVVAFGVSLLLHALCFGLWRVGQVLGPIRWLDQKWLEAKEQMDPKPKDEPKVIPMTFVEVDPSTASQEAPPEETAFYSVENTRAANPDPVEEETTKPKIDGEQEQILRLADNPKPKPFPLQPALPPEEAVETPPEETKPEPVPEVEKATLPQPGDSIRMGPPPETPPRRERPRTLAQVMAQDTTLAGRKVKQEGGVRRRGSVALDVKSTPFGAYDLAFIRAVEQRWFDLLDNTSFVQRSGKVVLEFKLNEDGRITDLRVEGNEVGEILGLLCQRAILDPAPYAAWPSDMRRLVGATFREVTFTFFYN